MSTIKRVPVSVNGHPIILSPLDIRTCLYGSDCEVIENRFEDRLVSQIDRKLFQYIHE